MADVVAFQHRLHFGERLRVRGERRGGGAMSERPSMREAVENIVVELKLDWLLRAHDIDMDDMESGCAVSTMVSCNELVTEICKARGEHLRELFRQAVEGLARIHPAEPGEAGEAASDGEAAT